MQPASTNDAALAEPGPWAASLGERWKYLQSSLANETPQDRQVFLEEELRRALQAGAAGYLLKDAPAANLAEAVRKVHDGGRAVDPELGGQAWRLSGSPRHALPGLGSGRGLCEQSGQGRPPDPR